MIRLLGACGAAIFLLGMLAGYMVSAFVPATAQSQMELISPEATAKTVSGLKEETVAKAI
ncbi:MAG: hypothetical protein K2Y27_01730 [Xanthobacteraceae bacterium]|nr:hypothetical protein [Xanthobacteraceae bacterium]